jgi:hypothetical protein
LEREFLMEKLERIEKMRVATVGGFGFKVRCASYFYVRPGMSDSGFYVALVSMYSLFFCKWNEVHKNLGASSSRIFTQGKDECYKPKSSINGVIAMFPSVALEDVTRVLVLVHTPPPSKKKSGASPRHNKKPCKKRRGSAACSSSSSPSSAASEHESAALGRKKKRMRPASGDDMSLHDRTPLAAVVRSSPRTPSTTRRSLVATSTGRFDGGSPCPRASLAMDDAGQPFLKPIELLADKCLEYLTAPTLDGTDALAKHLAEFLANPLQRGRVGIFLLNHGVLTMFMHAAHLKELAFSVLHRQFDMRPATLNSKDVKADDSFPALELELEACSFLLAITDFHADIPGMLSFCLYDLTSVLVFTAVHVVGRVRCKRRPESADSVFLGSERNVLHEVCRPALACSTGSSRCGNLLPCSCSGSILTSSIFSSASSTSRSIVSGSTRTMPGAGCLRATCRSRASARTSSRTSRPTSASSPGRSRASSCTASSACPPWYAQCHPFPLPFSKSHLQPNAQFRDIKESCGIHDYGMPVAVFQQLQTCRRAFNQIRVADEAAFLLPATLHSEAPHRHAADSAALAQLLSSL